MPPVDIQSSHGAKLLIEDSGTPGTYIEIGGVGDIDGPGSQAKMTERGTHDKDNVQRVPGLVDYGTVGCPVEWNGTDPGQVELLAQFKKKANFQIQYPDANQSQDSFAAYVTNLSRSAPVEGTLQRQLTLTLDSAVTEGTWT